MNTRRRYDDACAGAHALNLVGERWALLVARELMLGPKRFTDLRADLPGISPNVLSQRLDEFEAIGVVRRRQLPPPAPSWVYELTEWGRELEPVLMALGRWGARSYALPRDAELSVTSLILSFRTMFDAAAAVGFTATYNLTIGPHRFVARVVDGELDISPGTTDDADASIEGPPMIVAAVVYDGQDPAPFIRSGDLKVEGDEVAIKRFLTLFTLPERVPAPEGYSAVS
jgi:DNA-binding HxlR family transcriptional regulator